MSFELRAHSGCGLNGPSSLIDSYVAVLHLLWSSKRMRTAGYFPEVERPELEAGPHLLPLSVKSYDFMFTTSIGRSVVTTACKLRFNRVTCSRRLCRK